MLEIDGSYGEGGGQILRTSVSLSAVTGMPVKVSHIRAKRPKPGLAPSHIASIEAVTALADAEVDGLYPGSKELVFRPRELVGGQFEFDVGTAGSISLIILTCLLPANMSKANVILTVKGGTDVRWSPPIDYLDLVHLPLIAKMGCHASLEVTSRGFYPEGGGEVRVEASPAGGLLGIDLCRSDKVTIVAGVAYAQNLPDHVISRMKHAAQKRLIDYPGVKVATDLRKGRSTGAGIVLAAASGNSLLGESALGEKGVRAEVLGENCASDLIETIKTGATVDSHMADQILPYMALAKGHSRVVVEDMTQHAKTNMWVIEQFLGRRFVTEEIGALTHISTV